jgi:hypothetical protein
MPFIQREIKRWFWKLIGTTRKLKLVFFARLQMVVAGLATVLARYWQAMKMTGEQAGILDLLVGKGAEVVVAVPFVALRHLVFLAFAFRLPV